MLIVPYVNTVYQECWYITLPYVCHQTLPPRCEGVGTRLDSSHCKRWKDPVKVYTPSCAMHPK